MLFFTCCLRVEAQSYPNGLAMDSVRPDIDSIFIACSLNFTGRV